MRAAFAIVLAATGCDQLFSLQHLPDAPVDHGGDDGPVLDAMSSCARQVPPPAVCADFDEQPPVVYVGGTIMAAAPNEATFHAPAQSNPNAAWFTQSAVDGVALYNAGMTTAKSLDATLWIYTDGAANVDTTLVKLKLPWEPVYETELAIDSANHALMFESHSTSQTQMASVGAEQQGWLYVHLVLDAAAGAARLQLGGQGTHGQTIDVYGGTGVMGQLSFGLAAAATPGFTVAYDDITVIAN